MNADKLVIFSPCGFSSWQIYALNMGWNVMRNVTLRRVLSWCVEEKGIRISSSLSFIFLDKFKCVWNHTKYLRHNWTWTSSYISCPSHQVGKNISLSICVQIMSGLFESIPQSSLYWPLWAKYKNAILNGVKVGNIDCPDFTNKPRWRGASELFCNAWVNMFHALLRNLFFQIYLWNCSQNVISMLVSHPLFYNTNKLNCHCTLQKINK